MRELAGVCPLAQAGCAPPRGANQLPPTSQLRSTHLLTLSSQAAAEALREEKAALETKAADQDAKLVDSSALLQSNQQMIQWLNQQLNEAQLGSMGASSRYSFRPSGLSLSLPSSTPAAATAATTARTTAPVPTTAPSTTGPVTYRKPTAVTPPVVPAV